MSIFELTKRVAQITCSKHKWREGGLFLIAWLSSASHLTGKIGYIFICDWQLVYIVSFFFINYAIVHSTNEANVQLLKWARHNVHEFRNIHIYVKSIVIFKRQRVMFELAPLQWTDRYTYLLCSHVWPILKVYSNILCRNSILVKSIIYTENKMIRPMKI